MAKYVNVAALQFATKSAMGDRAALVRETAEALDGLRGYGLDLVVVSEGVEAYAQSLAQAEPLSRPGPVLKMYQAAARRLGAHVAGSMKVREGSRAYNSLVFVSPRGKVLGAYHKSNLTIGEIEEGLVPGKGAVVVDTPVGRLGGAICFDLNFPWLRDDYAKLAPDLLCFSSMFHGGAAVQSAWAMQCRAFFVSALPYAEPPTQGGVRDPLGQPLAMSNCYVPVPRARINLDRAIVHLDFNRDKFARIERKYGREVRIEVPPDIGQALIYSESPRRTALDLVREFRLELRDDYFVRALARNAKARA